MLYSKWGADAGGLSEVQGQSGLQRHYHVQEWYYTARPSFWGKKKVYNRKCGIDIHAYGCVWNFW